MPCASILPQIVAGADVLTGGASTVRVPVKMLEHYRFRLRNSNEQQGVGQGQAKPGDRIGRPQQDSENQRGQGGNEDGGVQYTLEFRIDDIVDWLWEEMKLPNLEAKAGRAKEDDWTREGWDRRGARSRLDRRRSMKESIKRRGVQAASGAESPAFTDEDLRYRQLAKREQPAMQAVVILLLDVSGSMGERERQISKTFFFWAIQGLRRQYRHLELVFVAHTSEAWEFERRRVLQSHRHRRHGGLGGLEEGPPDHRRALQPEPVQRLFVLRLRRRELPVRSTAGAGRAGRSGRRLQLQRLPGSRAAGRLHAGQRDRQTVRRPVAG